MFKIFLAFSLAALLVSCAGHKLDSHVYSEGDYSNSPFEYPSTLRRSEVEFIVDDIKRQTPDKIGTIKIGRDLLYDVFVCSHIDSPNAYNSHCKKARLFRFGYGRSGLANFQITPHTWHDFPIKEGYNSESTGRKKYVKGKYKNIPIMYPNEISETEINRLVEIVNAVSSGEIISIKIENEKSFEIATCTAGSRLLFHCGAGETILYDRIEKKVVEQNCCWVQ